MSQSETINQIKIIRQIDACVSCGLCLTVCPTYKISGNEAESPRGRLSIIKGLISNDFTLNSSTHNHLDQCLMCGACEIVCPAKVEYTAIMQDARYWQKKKRFGSFYDKFFSWLVFKNWRVAVLGKLISLYKFIGFQKLFPIHTLKPFVKEITNKQWKKYYPAIDGIDNKGDVYLFKGCVASIFDRDTIESSIAMLNIAGFNVLFPDEQGCCGSLASHSGDMSRTRILREKNEKVFNLKIPLIVTSTGCVESVSEFFENESMVYDVMEFLAIHLDLKSSLPMSKKILIHTPCSQRKRAESVFMSGKLLSSFCLNITDISEQHACCGSAGTYMYRNQQLADQIVLPLINTIREVSPEYIVTQNIGCRMQLMNHSGKNTAEVMHPVTLMYRHELKQL